MKKNVAISIIAVLAVVIIALSVLYISNNNSKAKELAEKADQIAALNADVTDKAGQIETLTAEAADKTSQIETLKTEIAGKEKEIETINTDAAGKAGQIEILNADTAEKANEIETLKADVAGKEKEIETLNATIKEKESRTVTINVLIDRNNGKDPVKYRMNIIMVRESDGLWYIDPTSLKSYENIGATEVSLLPTLTPAAEPETSPDTPLYYNPNGGEFYHRDQNCKRIKESYLPLQGQFTYADLNKPEYSELKPCGICEAPVRPAQ